MPRQPRTESETGYYHVMMRGINKEKIFISDQEKTYFLELLQSKTEEIKLVAYCIMDNHVHLLIHAELQEMTKAIKWINIKFASKYNHKYKRVGPVFQDRYKSEVINSDRHLIEVTRYIHNNPVKANIVQKAKDYKWSSYKNYIINNNKLINSDEKKMIMDLFSKSINEFEAFHLKEDTKEYLETKEDLEIERNNKAQRIIEKYCNKNGIVDIKELKNKAEILEDIITELLEKSNLTHRKIAELIDVTRGTVHTIAKKEIKK